MLKQNFAILLLVTWQETAWIACLDAAEQAAAATPQRCDVVWRTPSHDSLGSMPIGNGDIGLNVWVEEGGDLLFYLAKTDAWSENARLLKLGRVRVKLTPNPLCGRVLRRSRRPSRLGSAASRSMLTRARPKRPMPG